MKKLTKAIRQFTQRLDGSVAVTSVIALPTLLVIGALAIDYGMALTAKSENQRTADLAVHAAASTYIRMSEKNGDPLAVAEAEAARVLRLNGLDAAPLKLTLLPPDEGRPRFEAVIDQTLPAIGLIRFSGEEGLRVVVKSIALVEQQSPDRVCMYATGTGTDGFDFGGNSRLLLGGCSIQSNSGFNLPSGADLDIGGCITPEGKTAPAECPSVKRAEGSSNPLGVEWDDIEAECINAGRPSTNLSDYQNGLPIPTGIHCITEDVKLTGGTFFSATGGVALFFRPGIDVSIAGNPTFSLQPADEITLQTNDGPKFIRNVLLYGPEANFTARGTMEVAGLGCYGITMKTIDFRGNPEISLNKASDAICDLERDLGLRAGVNVRFLE